MTPTPVGAPTGPGSASPSPRSDPPEAPPDQPAEPGRSPLAEPAAGDSDALEVSAEASAAEPAGPGGGDVPAGRSRFAGGLAGVAALAAGIQALFIQAVSHRATLPSSGWYDTVQASELVRGHWLIDPVRATTGAHLLVPTAAHPPLPTVLLAIADVASATGPTSHMVFSAILFVASVVLTGVTVRDLAGERAGLLAALVMATFPLLWVNPATVGPETAVIAVTTLLLFAAGRFWATPSTGHAALVGLALGLCALTRTDLVALVVLVGLPLGLLVKRVPWAVRLRGVAVMGILGLLVVGPWVGRNLSLFGRGVVLSQDYGPAVAGANCAATVSGPLEGWWSPACVTVVPPAGAGRPATAGDQVRAARTFDSHHRAAVVEAAAARLGRMWDVYRPGQTAALEAVTGRPAWVSRLGRWYLYVLAPLAVVGAVVLRRRRLLLFPFVAVIVLSSLTAVLAFGDARFAVDADVSLAMLAGVALDAGAGAVARQFASGPGRHSAGRKAGSR